MSTNTDYLKLAKLNTSGLPPLPKGWTWTSLSAIAELKGGITKGQKRKDDAMLHSVPYLRVANVQRGYLDLADIKHIEATEEEINELRLSPGDMLFNEGGDRDKLGRGWIWRGEIPECIHQNHVFRARLYTSDIQPKLISWYGNSFGQRYFVSEGKQTTNLASINLTKLGALPVPLPPANEQHRIVAEIETQFTRLDVSIVALKRVQANLKRYRASVLQAACEGRLVPTEAELARAEGRSYESADQLLQRILLERRARWETEQLADMKAKGKVPKDDRWKSRYKEPVKPDTSELPALPEGWVWAKVEQLVSPEPRSLQSGPFGSNLLHSEFQDIGVLAIGIDNVLEGRFSMGRQHRISLEKYAQLEKYTARPLDVLVTVMATVGRCCVVPANLEPAIITKHVYRISANQDIVDPHYLMITLWGGAEVRRQIFSQVQGQTRPGINGEILQRIAIPIPPLPEQHSIVAEVERRLSVIDELEATIAANLKRADRLRQAILKRAFEGKLVPQDPTDEPASILLERIHAERGHDMAKPKATRQKTNSHKPTGPPIATAPVQGELALGFRE